MKSILYHIILICVVFFGIFLGTLPDLWPSVLSSLPYFNRLDSGLKSLDNFSTPEIKNTYLNQDDNGYVPIYRLLRSLDPYTLPPVKEILALSEDNHKAQLTGVQSGLKWSPTTNGIKSEKAMQTIYICFRTERGTVEPICEMPELKFLIRDFKTRWCSRIGFFFAFVALILGEGVSLRKSVKHWQDKRMLQDNE